MALQATRLLFRVTLSNVDRNIEREENVNVARHPSETQDHVILRMLAWCMLWEEQLEFGPGLSTPDTPDLWARDLTGRITSWIECRAVENVKKLVSTGAKVSFVLDDPRKAEEVRKAARELKKGEVTIYLIDRELVKSLAARDERQHKWQVTYVGDHFYIDADGESLEGSVQIERTEPL